MNAAQLHAALIALPITEDRLRKASKRAESPSVYAQVLEQLAVEGRWPLSQASMPVAGPAAPSEPEPPSAVQADELPAGLSYETAWPLGAVLKVGGHEHLSAADARALPQERPRRAETRRRAATSVRAKKVSTPVGKKKRPKGY